MEGHDPLLTTAEVAALFRVEPKTVLRWKDAGKLHPIPTPGGLPRYRTSEVRALLATQTAGPAPPPPSVGPVPAHEKGRPREE